MLPDDKKLPSSTPNNASRELGRAALHHLQVALYFGLLLLITRRYLPWPFALREILIATTFTWMTLFLLYDVTRCTLLKYRNLPKVPATLAIALSITSATIIWKNLGSTFEVAGVAAMQTKVWEPGWPVPAVSNTVLLEDSEVARDRVKELLLVSSVNGAVSIILLYVTAATYIIIVRNAPRWFRYVCGKRLKQAAKDGSPSTTSS